MATTKRRARTSRHELTAYKAHELMTGVIFYPVMRYTGYGNPQREKEDLGLCDGELKMSYEHSVHPHGSGRQTYPSAKPYISDEMRRDWETHRDALLRWWVSGEYSTDGGFASAGLNINAMPWLFYRGYPGTRPWAWWQFDALEPLGDEDEAEYLSRLDLLLPGELENGNECRLIQ